MRVFVFNAKIYSSQNGHEKNRAFQKIFIQFEKFNSKLIKQRTRKMREQENLPHFLLKNIKAFSAAAALKALEELQKPAGGPYGKIPCKKKQITNPI